MEVDLKELVSILKAEKDVFIRYLGKLVDQQKSLIENDLQGIKSSVEQINALAQEAVTLESGRKAVIERISNKLGVNPDDITISRLLEKFKGSKFEELEELKNMILEINAKIKNQKNRNELLIESSMNVIKETINYLNEVNNPRVTYRNPVLTRRGGADRSAIFSRTG